MSGIKDTLGDTPFIPPTPRGSTFIAERDSERLAKQARRVFDTMKDGNWRTLWQIAMATGDPEASISARLRDLRGAGYTVEREFMKAGQHKYRVTQ